VLKHFNHTKSWVKHTNKKTKTKNHHELHIIAHNIHLLLETLSLPDNDWILVEQGDQEHRQVSDSITFQSQGKFILLISLSCTGFETTCKVLTSNSNISKGIENLFS
jgi:hypothetical protein